MVPSMTRQLQTLLLLVCLTVSPPALAGDPCPISFVFFDLKAPPWLDHAQLLDALESKDSWVGISFVSGKDGVRVRRVSNDSPAARAGLLVKDVITAAGGKTVRSHDVLADLFRKAAPGTRMKLDVLRAGTKRSLNLTMGAQDPVVGALIDHASKQECARVRRANLTAEQVTSIQKALFSKARRFRCKDAHRALRGLKYGGRDTLEGGDLVVVRGSKRLLVTNQGWRTTCLKTADFDGARLTDKAIARLFRKVTGAFVADRHANP